MKIFTELRSLLSYLTLYGLLAVSVIAVLPWELVIEENEERVTFIEGENEDGPEKEGKEKKKDKRKKHKEKEAKKYLRSARVCDALILGKFNRYTHLLPKWEAPHLPVISPPPESLLG